MFVTETPWLNLEYITLLYIHLDKVLVQIKMNANQSSAATSAFLIELFATFLHFFMHKSVVLEVRGQSE